MRKMFLHIVAFALNAYASFVPGVSAIRLPRPEGIDFNFGLENNGSDGHFTVSQDL